MRMRSKVATEATAVKPDIACSVNVNLL